MIPGDPQWLEEHGIDPAVFAERGVERYDRGDVDKVLAAVGPFLRPRSGKDPERSLRGRIDWYARGGKQPGVVNQSGGLILPKTPPPGWEDDPGLVPPQLRPDERVISDYRPGKWHFHGRLEDQPLSKTTVRRAWPRVPTGKAAGKALIQQDVLSPDNEGVLNHIRKHHGGVNTQEVHRHDRSQPKYLFLPGSDEARIDLHPRAARLLPEADRVFLVLEGVLKNDAVLSAGEAVFSVPSVTLWDREELRRFAEEFLVGKRVFVVPDADWVTNPMVDWQALLVRTYLREVLGEDMVYIAAPPVEFFEAMKIERDDDTMKGVDDWLGVHGREWAERNPVAANGNEIRPGIDGLVIRGKEPGRPSPSGTGYPWWKYRWGEGLVGIRWSDPAWAPWHAMTLLSLQGPRHDRALNSLANVMDVSTGGHAERALPTLRKLADDWRAIKIHGSLDWEKYEYDTVDEDARDLYYKQGAKAKDVKDTMTRKDWKERPMIEMQDGFEAYETPRTLLGDYWTRETHALAKEAREDARETARELREIKERLGLDDDEGRHLRRVR